MPRVLMIWVTHTGGLITSMLKITRSRLCYFYKMIFAVSGSHYLGQKVRFYVKVEVMDDILTGMMEDLLENDSFDESQKVHERF